MTHWVEYKQKTFLAECLTTGFNSDSPFRFLSNARCCRGREIARDNGNAAVGNGNATDGGFGMEARGGRIGSVVAKYFRSRRGRGAAAFADDDDTTLEQVRFTQPIRSLSSKLRQLSTI